MDRTRDNDGDQTGTLCELCGREPWVAKVNNIKLCKECLNKIEESE
jgi:hypothetical protein